MSVIVELRVDGDEFALGRVLDPPAGGRVELGGRVAGDGTVPFWVAGDGADPSTAVVRDDHAEAVRSVGSVDGRTLYALEWHPEGDRLLAAADDAGGELLECRGRADHWEMELRFPDEAALSEFTDWCSDNDVGVDVADRYLPRQAPPYGLTERQHTTLSRAVQAGYYDIPRTTTTQELADELGVSDQAVTERLRRAITSLVEATLLADDRR